jgi:hypothetical protein
MIDERVLPEIENRKRRKKKNKDADQRAEYFSRRNESSLAR